MESEFLGQVVRNEQRYDLLQLILQGKVYGKTKKNILATKFEKIVQHDHDWTVAMILSAWQSSSQTEALVANNLFLCGNMLFSYFSSYLSYIILDCFDWFYCQNKLKITLSGPNIRIIRNELLDQLNKILIWFKFLKNLVISRKYFLKTTTIWLSKLLEISTSFFFLQQNVCSCIYDTYLYLIQIHHSVYLYFLIAFSLQWMIITKFSMFHHHWSTK